MASDWQDEGAIADGGAIEDLDEEIVEVPVDRPLPPVIPSDYPFVPW